MFHRQDIFDWSFITDGAPLLRFFDDRIDGLHNAALLPDLLPAARDGDSEKPATVAACCRQGHPDMNMLTKTFDAPAAQEIRENAVLDVAAFILRDGLGIFELLDLVEDEDGEEAVLNLIGLCTVPRRSTFTEPSAGSVPGLRTCLHR